MGEILGKYVWKWVRCGWNMAEIIRRIFDWWFEMVFEWYENTKLEIETGPQKTGQDQNLTSNKKSTIFELSTWKLVKMTTQWGGLFDQVS